MSVKVGDKIRITDAMPFEPYKNGDMFTVADISYDGSYVKVRGLFSPIARDEFEIITKEEVDSMKAKKGDLIRITTTYNGSFKLGDIAEVATVGTNGVYAYNTEGLERFVHHQEYVIHRKADEEDSGISAEVDDLLHEHYTDMAEEFTQDAVNHPNHYTQGKFETIEVIEEITKGYDDGFIAYCIGNTLKYIARAPFKHGTPAEDLAKAKRYIEFAIEHLDAKSTQ